MARRLRRCQDDVGRPIITEAYPGGGDIRLFGLMDPGPGDRALGYAMLSEIEDVPASSACRSSATYVEAEHRLSIYAKIARHAGMIVT